MLKARKKKNNTKLFIKQSIFKLTFFLHLTDHAKIIAKENKINIKKKILCSSVTTNSQI